MPNLLAVMRAHNSRPLLVSDRFLGHCSVLAGVDKGLAERVKNRSLGRCNTARSGVATGCEAAT